MGIRVYKSDSCGIDRTCVTANKHVIENFKIGFPSLDTFPRIEGEKEVRYCYLVTARYRSFRPSVKGLRTSAVESRISRKILVTRPRFTCAPSKPTSEFLSARFFYLSSRLENSLRPTSFRPPPSQFRDVPLILFRSFRESSERIDLVAGRPRFYPSRCYTRFSSRNDNPRALCNPEYDLCEQVIIIADGRARGEAFHI